LTNNLFIYEKIKTTESKAKELRSIAEKLSTKAKKNDITGRRILLKTLNPKTVKKIINANEKKLQNVKKIGAIKARKIREVIEKEYM